MLFLGLDLGSSSVKLAVLDGDTGQCLGSAQYPTHELTIASPQPGFAEQDPDTWWECVVKGFAALKQSADFDPARIEAIGISYQMHGLVMVDESLRPLRDAIIWCDSRAVAIGESAGRSLGDAYCFENLLNSPGNFTAAKLRWVQQNEPEIYSKIHKIMLPGDYIALRLSGEPTATPSGLSEGVMWDFAARTPAHRLFDFWGFDAALLPPQLPNIGLQATVSQEAAAALGIRAGVKIAYRGGDQPNNAFSLNAVAPGEVAATAGTSGVIYAVTDKLAADHKSRVNTFMHVTDTPEAPRNGVLVCVNGTGRLYSWLRQLLSVQGEPVAYPLLNKLASDVPVGSDGLLFYPFGNGAERIYQNRAPGGQLSAIDFNRHSLGHVMRAAQEGIVFALNQGFDVLKSLGCAADVVRVSKGNLFLSEVFASTFANATGAVVEIFDTDGALGAARGAALGVSHYASYGEAFASLTRIGVIEPNAEAQPQLQAAYETWKQRLPMGGASL